MIEITSIKNPIIKEIKSLYRKKKRIESKTFIIEGIKIIEEAIDNDYEIKNIVYTDKLFETRGGSDFFEKIKELEKLVYVSENVFKEISDIENPQGILAVGKFEYNELVNIEFQDSPFLLLLDELQDPGNMGTIIRTADAFNIDGILITEGCVDPYNPKVVRATMGSIFRVPIYYISNAVEELKELRNKGIKVYSTALENSTSIFNVNYKEGALLVIGNESRGVSQDIYSISDGLIRIPMPGQAESLNAGVAASIIMYEAMKQRS